MLLGTFEHSIDDKFRLTIPSKLRNKLGSSVYVSKGVGKYLELRTPENFTELLSEIKKNSSFNESTRMIERLILSNSDELSIDSSNRIKIPTILLEKIGVTKQIYILGLGNRMEIWDKATYDEEQKLLNEEKIYAAAEKLGGDK
ncbi:cell division protein MraZ [Spiroplasma helicoides]|uniref:Transcriptional regulator MraZ n=1 Tax=Spiroplasma helicoides TaxID=216938 RepID=A0A1B3SL61_9MOLU|nr:division/cell wall cluster transcriptional repressor MraZ [Spiroplasma helicoides]AOG60669.1 cell division protein MraZ [Spiroplasma helicoides]